MNIENQKQYSFLLNQKHNKVITKLKEYFSRCDEFKIVVAFILPSGVSLLKTVLKELEQNNIRGEIITSNYQNFTSPYAIDELNSLKNITIKMVKDKNLHMKGYFFKIANEWNIVVGSSNLTAQALTTNEELNINLISKVNSYMAHDMLCIFTDLWQVGLNYDDFIDDYLLEYNKQKQLNEKYEQFIKSENNKYRTIEPNSMQIEALNNLSEIRNVSDKALIIAATGTGKTYLSAFDVARVNPKKLLFIVHRENISRRAKESFESLIKDKTFGLYNGNVKEKADYVFATVQSIYNNLESFAKDEFDYIIIDEVHHGGAKTYRKVIDYFKPKFLLGLTATPKRSDNFNIFEMFNFHVACEITLNKAYEYDLLTPFHYFGVSDIYVKDQILRDGSISFNDLTSDSRVEHIINKINYYEDSSTKTCGLMFVSSTKEAEQLEQKLNSRGLNTKCLTSKHSEEVRLKAIDELENGNIDYLITVDIFNEGIDIPSVNSIVLLRPTESAIVYVQQLGRGLRKYKGKTYVTVIDFIGNYKKNFLVPIALSGDATYDKDELRDNILPNITDYISGSSAINFESIAREVILKSINKVNFSQISMIKEDFIYLQNKMNKIPNLYDFYESNLIHPLVILKSKKIYLELKQTILKSVNGLNSKEAYEILKNNKNEMYLYLEYISQKLTPAKRQEEIQIIKLLLTLEVDDELTFDDIKNKLIEFGVVDDEVLQNALDHLSKNIFKTLSSLYKFPQILIYNKENNKYKMASLFFKSYKGNVVFKEEVDDLIRLNLKIYEDKYKEKLDNNNLIHIGEYYTKEEAFKYLLLDYSNGYQVGGYTLLKDQKVGLVFITLSDSAYSNKFFSNQEFNWFSKKQRKLKYANGDYTTEGLVSQGYFKLYIFMKKDISQNFIYIGKVGQVLNSKEIKDKNGDKLVEYLLQLERPLEDNLYKNFIGQ